MVSPLELQLPYIITIDEANGKILSIRRNYEPEDPLKKKKIILYTLNFYLEWVFMV